MEQDYKKYLKFNKRIFIIGFGSIGQAVLPLILRHLEIKPQQVTILTKNEEVAAIAKNFDVNFSVMAISQDNYQFLLRPLLQTGDYLLNLAVDVSSIELIKLCQEIGTLYLDTCIEPWKGGYLDPSLAFGLRSNYAMRERALALKNSQSQSTTSTALITHGANPGLVSHFTKQALLNMAEDNELAISVPTTQAQWAALAQTLQVKVIHIAEHDSQTALKPKRRNEFVNTWSIDGFVSEGLQPAELGWGTHERHWPHDALHHQYGSRCAIYLNRPGASTRVRTWTPLAGPFHGFLITHAEAISIADYFTLKEGDEVSYRPTVHYAYHPCEDAVLSLHELAGREWQQQQSQRLLFDDIVDGIDELGVLLMGNPKGAYWYGSQLSIHQARELVLYNNATSLQVAVSVFAGLVWSIEHPNRGVTEPEEVDYQFILSIARPYLGKLAGYYNADWNPLKERERLCAENIDKTDPWQFLNIRVD